MPKLVRIVIQLPLELKLRLDELKQQGYTTSGFIKSDVGTGTAETGAEADRTQAAPGQAVKDMRSSGSVHTRRDCM